MKNKSKNYRSVLQGLLTCIIFIILTACDQSSKKNIPSANTPEHKDTIIRKPPASFSDTLIIQFPSTVFYNPDSLQLKKIEEITEKNEYETEVHNCFYLMRNARHVMKQYWPKIRIVETSTHRYLLFVKADKTKAIIDLDSTGDQCGIFLFDGKKNPELADMMNIDTALGFYFGH
jgi:hypothetical protein